MKINIEHKGYRLADGDVLFETRYPAFGNKLHSYFERRVVDMEKFKEKTMIKSLSKEKLYTLKEIIDKEILSRNFDYSILLNFNNDYRFTIKYFDKYDIFIQTGGRASGKSCAGMRECLFLAFGCDKKVACLHPDRYKREQYKYLAKRILLTNKISFVENEDELTKDYTGFLYMNENLESIKNTSMVYDVIYIDDAECLNPKQIKNILKVVKKDNIKLILNLPNELDLMEYKIYRACTNENLGFKTLIMKSSYSENKFWRNLNI